jgi:hypothetical protein
MYAGGTFDNPVPVSPHAPFQSPLPVPMTTLVGRDVEIVSCGNTGPIGGTNPTSDEVAGYGFDTGT